MALLVVKFLLFFFLLLAFKVSGRASYLAALALTNYSEFGLIVAHLSVQEGWMSQDWLVIIALVMSISFILSTFAYRKAHHYYAVYKDLINRFELKGAHQPIETPGRCRSSDSGYGPGW